MKTIKILLSSALILFGILDLNTSNSDTLLASGALFIGSILLLSCVSFKNQSNGKRTASGWLSDGGSGWGSSDGGGDCGGGGD